MLQHLKNNSNETTTANGAFAYESTKSYVMDLFAMGGAFRQRSDQDVAELFSKAYGENPVLALKTLFYLRDIEQGQGERRFFKVALKHLALHNPQSLKKNIHLVPAFGRFDDLLVLLDTSLKGEVISLYKAQFEKDLVSETPSLLAKWLPSENASSPTTKRYGRVVREGFGLTPKQYRKNLSLLRKKIEIVESKLSQKQYEKIEYDKLPSKAGLVYRNAFLRNDGERYREFLDKLSSGEATVNAKTLFPYDIVGKAFQGYDGRNVWSYGDELKAEEIQLLDAQWNSLPNYFGEEVENSIVVADTSGSMEGAPMNVAVSLAIYAAERNKGQFHNHFFTFSTKPKLQQVVGSNIVEKARNLSDSDWGGSTNVEAVFQKILDVAVKNNVSADEMIGKVYIISDMQFDYCVDGAKKHIFKNMEEKFARAGYKLPNLVFWNVNAFQSNVPFEMNEAGVQLVSGFSPTIFKQLLDSSGMTPYELMLEVILSERYAEVTA